MLLIEPSWYGRGQQSWMLKLYIVSNHANTLLVAELVSSVTLLESQQGELQ